MAMLRTCDKELTHGGIQQAQWVVSAPGHGPVDVCSDCLADFCLDLAGRHRQDAEGQWPKITLEKIR